MAEPNTRRLAAVPAVNTRPAKKPIALIASVLAAGSAVAAYADGIPEAANVLAIVSLAFGALHVGANRLAVVGRNMVTLMCFGAVAYFIRESAGQEGSLLIPGMICAGLAVWWMKK